MNPKFKQYNINDIIISYLMNEGYVENKKNANGILFGMSQKWKESIIEGYKELPIDKMLNKVNRISNQFDKEKDLIKSIELVNRTGKISSASLGVKPI